ncbi:glycosyl transferase [Lacinutrix sp. C3R15]|uniref:ATP-grasp fold amidoligase family protein n=1 Tax=Flavobacteriaceae TaxID=49546 RepID=UPI001C09468B|nr:MULTISPECIES: ATP-grasp fold amidoligase family protein [Flavobacteriaceae]MBU2938625.1 glycosyl transferase [Lacinutrix sp. C3R15]MDO6621939.1 ATP-grasp fold amidoligase family protein [Oceanihabitans sp. 1_MG-2023]
MKQLISNIYHNTRLGFAVIQPFKNVYEYLRYALIPDKTVIKKEFKTNLGYTPNFENPKTFNEKLQWLKLNDRTPLHTICADKYKVREYVKEKIGEDYLIPLVLETKNVRDIVPENLPDYPFIIKTNHDSSGGIIVRDKSKHNWINVQNTLAKFLNINYYYRYKEWQYKNIERRVVVEKLLMDENGGIPFDYKMHYFNGKLIFTQVDIDRQIDHRRNLYDANWNLLDIQWIYKTGRDVEKPKLYDKMIALGETFAKDFCYIRVDFYHVNDKIYFGELTFHAESGCGAFTPGHYDTDFGELLKLHKTVVS